MITTYNCGVGLNIRLNNLKQLMRYKIQNIYIKWIWTSDTLWKRRIVCLNKQQFLIFLKFQCVVKLWMNKSKCWRVASYDELDKTMITIEIATLYKSFQKFPMALTSQRYWLHCNDVLQILQLASWSATSYWP